MQKTTHTYRWITLFLCIALFLFSYLNQFIYRYEVPPGADALGHLRIVKAILSGDYSSVIHYHTLWHLLVAAVSIMLHIRSITAMAWLGPLLLFGTGVSLYIFNKQSFGSIAGLSSLVLIGFLSNQPLQTLNDGSFPNVLAAGIVLPLVILQLAAFVEAKGKQKIFQGILLLVLVGVLLFSHHVTTLYTIPVVGLFFFIFFFRWSFHKKIPIPVTFICLMSFVAFSFLFLYFFFQSPVRISAQSLARQFMAFDWHFPFIHLLGKLDNPDAIWSLADYPSAIGEAVVFLGIAGLLVGIGQLFRPTRQWSILLLLILWTILLFIGSRLTSVQFPVRLARDLAIPLALLGGYFIQVVVDYIRQKHLPLFFIPFFLLACLFLGSVTALNRWHDAIDPNPLVRHLAVDSQAAAYIRQNIPASAKIGLFQDDLFLSEFTPSQTVVLFYDIPKRFQELTDVRTAELALTDIDYLYLERRYDREKNWLNDDNLVATYQAAPFTILVKKFEQPEKAVYLFKIVHRKPVASAQTP